jgi:hypothetical protein
MYSYNPRTNGQYAYISVISVYDCMHACMYVCMYACIYIRVCVCVCLNLVVYAAIMRQPGPSAATVAARTLANTQGAAVYTQTDRQTHTDMYI